MSALDTKILLTSTLNVRGWKILKSEDHWRFVNHTLKEATVGFMSQTRLKSLRNGFLDTPEAKVLRQERYQRIYSQKGLTE